MIMKTTVDNDSNLLRQISKGLLEDLRKKKINEDIIFDIYIAFEEALRNAAVHGNKSDPDKKVTVDTEIYADSVVIAVEDEGPGFDPESLPDPTLEENLLREGGRGVYLIKHLMDKVEYENGGRRVVMKKKTEIKK
ncbi:MAG: ATP-binding protein [Candidatus Omnitrophota bacterium]